MDTQKKTYSRWRDSNSWPSAYKADAITTMLHRRVLGDFLCSKQKYVWDEIRTRASEETSALNWRLRPLGHPNSSDDRQRHTLNPTPD